MEFTYQKPNSDVLNQFGRNINNEIKNNNFDPIIGREKEIRRLIEIISRKTKNNPVLIGEPGVGKTAIVEGFVQRIVNHDVPNNLLDKQVYELSLSSLVAGASYQGQFEDRIKKIINQVKAANGNIILFIDEIHQLIGTGRNSGGTMDVANILKPMMARGEIKIIGATTLDEYHKYIEKDLALERRMQKIFVAEPTKEEAITIMRGLKEKWEIFHQVKIHDSAIVAAVNLSDRYLTNHYLPDKSIDLIDEAAAKIKTQFHSLPNDLDEMKREIINLETAKAALLKEEDLKSKKQLEEVETKLSNLKSKQELRLKEWQKQKSLHDEISSIKNKIENAKLSLENHQQKGEFTQASQILYETIPQLQKQLQKVEKSFEKINVNHSFSDSVTVNEVAEVVAEITGIPLTKLLKSEKDKLMNLNQEIKKNVKGQDEAINLVTAAVLRARVNINDPNRPLGSFLFLGPTGVGKTQLAKALALSLFDSDKQIVRFDMSEYMEKHSVAKLIGAPPGYVGYEQGGLLTQAIKNKSYCVLLFDEIEKAHPDVLNILLQVLDDGHLKDNQGKLINFKNTIIIMTSNLGSQEILKGKKDDKIPSQLLQVLKPEFINRIDEIIQFNPLKQSVIKEIVKEQIAILLKRISDNDFKIDVDQKVIDYIAINCYDPFYGARPIKRFIQKNLENLFANEIISGKINKNEKYLVVVNNKKTNQNCFDIIPIES